MKLRSPLGFALRLGFCVLAGADAALAHHCFPNIGDLETPAPITIHVGETAIFTIDPSGATEHLDSDYALDPPQTNPAVAMVDPGIVWEPVPFVGFDAPGPAFNGMTSNLPVDWVITGKAVGNTDISFHWEYKRHHAQGTFTVHVSVVPALGSGANNAESTSSVDPVNTRNGELFALESLDLNLGGPLPVFFSRYYGSNLASDGKLTSALGANRAHNFDMTLTTDGSSTAEVVTSHGRVVQFERFSDPSFGFVTQWFIVGRQDIPYQLVQKGTVFRFADPASQMISVFDQATGNLTTETDELGKKSTFTYNGRRQVLTATNPTGGVATYTYEEINAVKGNVVSITDNDPLIGTTTYTYDGFSRLTKITHPDTTHIDIAYDAGDRITSSFYHFDRVGSTLALTDGMGNVTDSYAYTPYGEPFGHGGTPGTNTQPFTFVGAFGVRAEGPLYQMRARYYDPLTARFLSRDPGGPRLADVRTLDAYLYALGNPTRYVDPNGAQGGNYGIYRDRSDETAFGLFFGMSFLGLPGPTEQSEDEVFVFGVKPVVDNPTTVEQPTLPPNEVFGEAAAAATERDTRMIKESNKIDFAVETAPTANAALFQSRGANFAIPEPPSGKPGQPADTAHATEFSSVAVSQTGLPAAKLAKRGGGRLAPAALSGWSGGFFENIQDYFKKLRKLIKTLKDPKKLAELKEKQKAAADKALGDKNKADAMKQYGVPPGQK